MTDEIANKLYLICSVRRFSKCKLLFKEDDQFNDIEQVETKIISQMRLYANAFDVTSNPLGGASANSVRHKSSSQRFVQAGSPWS